METDWRGLLERTDDIEKEEATQAILMGDLQAMEGKKKKECSRHG